MHFPNLSVSRFRWQPLLLVLPFVLAGLGLVWWPSLPTTPTVHHINLDSSQFAFTPGRLQVSQGDEIVITLTASDVVHGFYLDGYGLQTRVEPGIARQITFVVDQAGKFRYRCSVSCGPLHPFMIGELVVSPNTPFWRAAGLMLTALAGMLVYLWHSGKEKDSQ